LCALKSLQMVKETDPNDIYWRHITARAQKLDAPINGPENLASSSRTGQAGAARLAVARALFQANAGCHDDSRLACKHKQDSF